VILPSASQLDRAMACPASMTLPHVKDAPGPWAARGTTLHKFVEDARRGPEARAAALKAIKDDVVRQEAEAVDLSGIPEAAEAEVALGYDPATDRGVRYSADAAGRTYPDDGLYHGTADLVFLGHDGAVAVWDWKTGRDAPLASEAWQLKFLALAAARYAGVDSARVSIMQLGFDGHWHQDEAALSGWDLDDTAAALKALPARAQTASLSPGSWCKYCPALAVCPAQVALARAVLNDAEQGDDAIDAAVSRVGTLTKEQAGVLWGRVEMASRLIERLQAAIKTRALQEAVPLPDGRKITGIKRRDRVVKPGIVDELVRLLGTEAVIKIASVGAPDVEASVPAEVLEILKAKGLFGYKDHEYAGVTGKRKPTKQEKE